MYCSKCGQQIHDDAVVCVHCGCTTANSMNRTADDAPSGGLSVLGFFFPFVGLILYLVWHSEKPLKAKSVGKGAMIGAIVFAVIIVLYFVFFFSLFGMVASQAIQSTR